jgi:hypothetical protein
MAVQIVVITEPRRRGKSGDHFPITHPCCMDQAQEKIDFFPTLKQTVCTASIKFQADYEIRRRSRDESTWRGH